MTLGIIGFGKVLPILIIIHAFELDVIFLHEKYDDVVDQLPRIVASDFLGGLTLIVCPPAPKAPILLHLSVLKGTGIPFQGPFQGGVSGTISGDISGGI